MKTNSSSAPVALALCLFGASQVYAADWRKELFDPQPMAGDVALSLPCGGTLVLRKVVTDQVTDGPSAILTDRELVMGRPTQGARSYMENRREEHIAGAIGSGAGERFYLVGKYEVSAAQFKAVMAPDEASCPRFGPQDALPASNVSWYDAIEFTRRLNTWLYAANNSIGSLASLGITDGYVRLPTETEWEFAARSGLSVADAERANPTFPMPDGLDAYAWYNAPQSAQGKPKPVGTRKANPLGLFDVYGNVSEIVLEPFRMTRVDRLHGRIGGYTVRGGSFLDDATKLNSALREEYPFFAQITHGEYRVRSVGFRVAVGTAAIGRDVDPEELEQAAEAISRQGPNTVAPNATERINDLARATENSELRNQLQSLRSELDREFARRNEVEAKQIREAIKNAALMARELVLSSQSLAALTALLNDPDPNYDGRDQDQVTYDAELENFAMFRRSYTDAVQSLALINAEAVPSQATTVGTELRAQGGGSLVPFVDIVAKQVRDYANGSLTDTRAMVTLIIGTGRPWN